MTDPTPNHRRSPLEHEYDDAARMAGFIITPAGTRRLYVYLNPEGWPVAVIDAADIDGAWILATGWEDQAGIEQRKAQGWRVAECKIMWGA